MTTRLHYTGVAFGFCFMALLTGLSFPAVAQNNEPGTPASGDQSQSQGSHHHGHHHHHSTGDQNQSDQSK
jgi:hypothetical protein